LQCRLLRTKRSIQHVNCDIKEPPLSPLLLRLLTDFSYHTSIHITKESSLFPLPSRLMICIFIQHEGACHIAATDRITASHVSVIRLAQTYRINQTSIRREDRNNPGPNFSVCDRCSHRPMTRDWMGAGTEQIGLVAQDFTRRKSRTLLSRKRCS
jgi:hypothetical protein